jgi:hypothetical protein
MREMPDLQGQVPDSRGVVGVRAQFGTAFFLLRNPFKSLSVSFSGKTRARESVSLRRKKRVYRSVRRPRLREIRDA